MVSETQSTQDANGQKAEREPVRSARSAAKWQLPLLLIVLPVVLLAIYFKTAYVGLVHNDALDYAQVGHNISAGRGMVTYVLRPLALTHGTNILRQPDMTHGPLYPFLLALAFGARGASDTVAAGVSSLFYLLTVPLLYVLGLRVFNRTVGLIAAVAFAGSSLMLKYALSGLPVTLNAFLVTTLFLTLYNLSAGKAGQAETADAPLSTKLLVLTGILSGLLYLTDPLFFWLLPVVVMSVLWICGPKRRGALLKFALPLGILILPWMARNFMVTGNPVFGLRGAELWMYTGVHHYPGRTGYSLNDEDFIRGPYLIPAVIKKMMLGLNSVVEVLPQISNSWILAFLLPCLFFGYSSRSATLLRRTLVCAAVALLVGMLMFQIDMPLLTSLVPTMLVFSLAYMTHLIKQAKLSAWPTWGVGALLGITVLFPAISQMFLEEKQGGLPEASMAKALNKMVGPNEGVLSDQSEAVAWYADRPAIQIPLNDSRVAEIRTQFPTTRWLFLTPMASSQSEQWKRLYAMSAGWNNHYAEAPAARMEAPARIPNSPGQPLFEALEGFTLVPPTSAASLSTVVAVLPDTKLSMGSEPGRQPAP